MKILDYYTVMSIANKKPIEGLNKFALDTDCDVYPLKKDAVIVVCEVSKVGLKAEESNKYAMCIVSPWGINIVRYSSVKQKLIDDYGRLISNGFVNRSQASSNICMHVENNIKK